MPGVAVAFPLAGMVPISVSQSPWWVPRAVQRTITVGVEIHSWLAASDALAKTSFGKELTSPTGPAIAFYLYMLDHENAKLTDLTELENRVKEPVLYEQLKTREFDRTQNPHEWDLLWPYRLALEWSLLRENSLSALRRLMRIARLAVGARVPRSRRLPG